MRMNRISSVVLTMSLLSGCTSPSGDASVSDPASNVENEEAIDDGESIDEEDSTGEESAVEEDEDESFTVPDFESPYQFESRFRDGSSVEYTDAIVRQSLICEMKFELGQLTTAIDEGMKIEEGQVRDMLEFYYFMPEEDGCELEFLSAPRNALQRRIDELTCGVNLQEAMVDGSAMLERRDWGEPLVGWDVPGVTTPEQLMRHWISEIDAAAYARANFGEAPTSLVYLSADGVDRRQLLEKFMQAAITFAPAAAGHLDWDTPGQGLFVDNTTETVDGSGVTALEAGWDQAFAYFGANRTFGLVAAMHTKADNGQDVDGDELLDLTSEFAWGAAYLAAKRDVNVPEPLDIVGQSWEGFLGGRAIIDGAGGALNSAEQEALQGYAQQALDGWEAAVAASAIRHINKTLQLLKAGVEDETSFNLKNYAKSWSQAKGFALSFQFNPHSRMSAEEFATLHELLGMAPALPDSGAADYREALLSARALLGETYDFPEVNWGDDEGKNGW